jgi:Cu/Ag efflux protein CusF
MLAFDETSKLSCVGRFGCAVLLGSALLVLPDNHARAQGMSNMESMPATKGTASASGTGTVAAVNTSARKVTLNHGPLPAINWPAMKMEFAVAPSVDLSKVKPGDKVTFTLSGSKSSYTVQSMAPAK